MIIKCTEEQMLKMATLAVNASIPMGLGYLHFDPKEYEYEEVKAQVPDNYNVLRIDYFDGRMVKFYAVKVGKDEWQVAEKITPDYESWCHKYCSYEELKKAVE